MANKLKHPLKYCGILFLTFVFSFTLQAQEEDYFDADYKSKLAPILHEEFSEGIYKSFENFKTNTPIKEDNIVFYLEGERPGLFSNSEPVLLKKENGKERSYSKSYWGYCDSNIPYINYDGTLCDIYVLGTYCLFKHTRTTYTPGYMGPGGTMSPGTMTTTTVTMAMSLESGKINLLTKKFLKQVLQNNQQLLKQFNSERGKNKKLVEYIILYNKYQ